MIHSVSHITAGLFTIVSGADPQSVFLRKILGPDVSASEGWVLPPALPAPALLQRHAPQQYGGTCSPREVSSLETIR